MLAQLTRHGLAHAAWITEEESGELDEAYTNQTLPLKDTPFFLPGHHRTLRKQEVSLKLKHVAVWKDVLDKQIEHALVLEDDAVLSEGFCDKLAGTIDELAQDNINWDILFPGTCCGLTKQPHSGRTYAHATTSRCTHCYVITAEYAKVLLEHISQNNYPIDWYFNKLLAVNIGKCYWIEPAIAGQSLEYKSTVQL
jgi:GR25 family glycosyltransferase involved in LPS biosynthesis